MTCHNMPLYLNITICIYINILYNMKYIILCRSHSPLTLLETCNALIQCSKNTKEGTMLIDILHMSSKGHKSITSVILRKGTFYSGTISL